MERGNLPAADGNALYMLHLPADVVINDPRGIGVSCQTFCGYHHSTVVDDQSVY